MYDKFSDTAREELYLQSDAYVTTESFVKTQTDESTPTVTTLNGIRPHCVNIPVAVHQDSHLIYKSLAQYAKQKNCQPITTILHLNAPATEPTSVYNDAHDEITRAQQDFSQLDIRSLQTIYEEPRIGKIRSDLWKTALKTAINDSSISATQDIIGFNHDIDTEYLPTHYFAAVEKWYTRRRRNLRLINNSLNQPPDRSVILPYAITRAEHACRFDTHPNSSAVIAWSNLTSRLHKASYDAALILPFSRYAKSGGFKEDQQDNETKSIIKNSQDSFQPLNTTIPSLPLITSPRRYLERLHHAGLDNIWQEGTFGATDTCREITPPPDISREMAREHIKQSIEETFLSTATRQARERIGNKLVQHNFKYLHMPGDLPKDLGVGGAAPFASEEHRLIDRTVLIANRALRNYLGDQSLAISYDRLSETMRTL